MNKDYFSRLNKIGIRLLTLDKSVVFITVVMIFVICCLCVDTPIVSLSRCGWGIYICYALVLFVIALFHIYDNKEKLIQFSWTPILMLLFLWVYIYIRGAHLDYLIIVGSSILMLFVFEVFDIDEKYISIGLVGVGFVLTGVTIFRLLMSNDVLINIDSTTSLTLFMVLGMLSVVYLAKHSQNRWMMYSTWIFILINCVIFYILLARTALIASIFVVCYSLTNIRTKLFFSVVLALFVLLVSYNSIKSESTFGRKFILQTSLSIINCPEDFLIGRGCGGFGEMYMKTQADSLESLSLQEKLRADNIRHPLNEFVFWLIEYGFVAVGIVLILIVMALTTNISFCRLSVLVIVVFQLFSYPMKYPLSWMILTYVLSKRNIFKDSSLKILNVGLKVKMSLLIVMFVLMSVSFINQLIGYRNWQMALDAFRMGKYSEAEYYYEMSSKYLCSARFLHNWSNFENLRGNHEKALALIDEIRLYDYEIAMYKSKIHKQGCEYDLAISELSMAEKMCPNRFIPLFEKYMIYESLGDSLMLSQVRNEIQNKPVKIPSNVVESIKEYVMTNQN